jgi:drug/metabolite transporter (DMT)-like permease
MLKEPCGIAEVVVIVFVMIGSFLVIQPTFLWQYLEPVKGMTNETNQTVKKLTSSFYPNESLDINSTQYGTRVSGLASTNDGLFNPRMVGSLVAIGCSFVTALYYTVSRSLTKFHFTTIILQQSSTEMTLNCCFLFILGKWTFPGTVKPWFYLLGTSVFAALSRILVLLALKYEETSVIVTVRMSQVVFAYVLQMLFTTAMPNVFSICGALLITACAGACGILRWKRAKSTPGYTVVKDEELRDEDNGEPAIINRDVALRAL